MITYARDLNMNTGKEKLELKFSERDTDATVILSLHADEGEFQIESGTTVSGGGLRGDGERITIPASLDIQQKTITFTIPESMTAAPGRGVYQFALRHAGKDLHTPVIIIEIENAA